MPFLLLLLLLLTALGFGAAPALIALVGQTLPPATLGALRAALALPLMLMLVGAFGRGSRPGLQDSVTALVGGVLVVAIPFVALAAGLRDVPSAVGGMLFAAMPLLALLLGVFMLQHGAATGRNLGRLLLGMTGLTLVALPQFQAGAAPGQGQGTLLILLAALSHAGGTLWLRRRRRVSPLLLNAGMYVAAVAALWPFALLLDGRPALPASVGLLASGAALVVLATVVPALSTWLLMRRTSTGQAGLAWFLMPWVSVLIGVALMGESVTPLALAGLVIMLLSLLPGRPPRDDRAASPGASAPRNPEHNPNLATPGSHAPRMHDRSASTEPGQGETPSPEKAQRQDKRAKKRKAHRQARRQARRKATDEGKSETPTQAQSGGRADT